jgi:hypothetical protein
VRGSRLLIPVSTHAIVVSSMGVTCVCIPWAIERMMFTGQRMINGSKVKCWRDVIAS